MDSAVNFPREHVAHAAHLRMVLAQQTIKGLHTAVD
jgi:hypothetical protein